MCFFFSYTVNGRDSPQSDSDINIDEEFPSFTNGHLIQQPQPFASRGQTTASTSTTVSSRRNPTMTPVSILIPPFAR